MGTTVYIRRKVNLPDYVKIERYKKVPEYGPRILFFSGGNALKSTSKQIIHYTHNSIHLITPFDSGGSSAKLREAFNMIAVGDLRNRLMALAEQSVKGNPDIYRLFAFRLPKDEPRKLLLQTLYEIIWEEHALIKVISNPMKQLICNHLKYFIEHMPANFNLRGANIGNLIITGGYLNNNHDIDTVLYLFSKLVEVRGVVKPTLDKLFHLVSEMQNGQLLVGQHLITGKEHPEIEIPIKRIYISDSKNPHNSVTPKIKRNIEKLIHKAELICYPMGSFYSSVLSNLLPEGVSKAIAENSCPKIYIPNTTHDPEQIGMDLPQSVGHILSYLRLHSPETPVKQLLNFVLVDSQNGSYPYDLNLEQVRKMGVEVIDTELITEEYAPYICPKQLIDILLSLT